MIGARARLAGATLGGVCVAVLVSGAAGAGGADALGYSGAYEGTAIIVVADPVTGAARSATSDVLVTFAPPTGGDPNPFHLTIGPGAAGGPGAVTIVSVSPAVGGTGPPTQHWSFTQNAADPGAVAFTGRLADNSPVGGVVPNTLAASDAQGSAVLLALDPGARLSGRADDAGLVVAIDGTVAGGQYTFQVVIEARAVAGSAPAVGQQGVINMDSVLLLARPEVVSPTVATLDYGTVVTITGPSATVPYAGSYLPVSLADGTSGCVYEPFVDRIGAPVAPATGDAATILLDGVLLRDGPSYLAGVVATVAGPAPVTVTGAAVHDYIGGQDYLPVTLADGTSGWVLEVFVTGA